MADEAYWADLRPILQDMTDRIARIEQFLAASVLQAPGTVASPAGAGSAGEVFDSVPASFGAPPAFGTVDQVAAAPAGISPFGGPQPGVVPDDLLLLARSGKKIQAINELRKRTGIGLKQAKDVIDQVASRY